MDWRVFAVVFIVVLGLQLRSLSKRGVFGVICGESAAAETSRGVEEGHQRGAFE